MSFKGIVGDTENTFFMFFGYGYQDTTFIDHEAVAVEHDIIIGTDLIHIDDRYPIVQADISDHVQFFSKLPYARGGSIDGNDHISAGIEQLLSRIQGIELILIP